MKARLRDRWPILLAPLLFWAPDTALTYGGQHPRAARNAPKVVNELNPVAARALAEGVGTQLLMQTLWVSIIALPVLLLPRFWAIGYSFAWTFGHAAGAMVWLVYWYQLGYWLLYGYCPVVAMVFTWVAWRMFAIAPPSHLPNNPLQQTGHANDG